MKTLNFLLSIIAILLFWIAINLTPTATADKRWSDVNIAAVGGNAIYGDAVPTK
jgi:uncharacterized membrane protein